MIVTKKPKVTKIEDKPIEEYWIEKEDYWLVKKPNRMGLAGPMWHTRKVSKNRGEE